jgi:hypothetical protein
MQWPSPLAPARHGGFCFDLAIAVVGRVREKHAALPKLLSFEPICLFESSERPIASAHLHGKLFRYFHLPGHIVWGSHTIPQRFFRMVRSPSNAVVSPNASIAA